MSVRGNLKKKSVGGKIGQTLAESFGLTNYLICDVTSSLVVRRSGRSRRMLEEEKKMLLKKLKLQEVFFSGVLTYGIKNFCRCQNPYRFYGPLKVWDVFFDFLQID